MAATRREFLARGAALAAGSAVLGPGLLRSAARADSPSLAAATLADLARQSGRYFGSCASYGQITSDPSYAALLAAQCDVLVPQNELKWGSLRPTPPPPRLPDPAPVLTTTQADALVSWAASQNMRVRGNCFTWTNANPWWFFQPTTATEPAMAPFQAQNRGPAGPFINAENALQRLEEHITAVMGHFRGQVTSWDVVNEAILGSTGTGVAAFQPTPWVQWLGPRYIDAAFNIAHRVDPSAQLCIGEFNLEYANHYSMARQDAMLRLLDGLLSRGVPVHAVGVEAHLIATAVRDLFSESHLRGFLRRLQGLGLSVIISEIDMDDRGLPQDIPTRDRVVAEAYRRFLGAALSESVVEGVISWGLSDKYSWMNDGSDPRFNRPYSSPLPVLHEQTNARPLPYDGNLAAKPARSALAGALAGARRRR
jgi:endo-1,4-beta-xylanase